MKKIVSYLLVAMLAIGCLTGCGEKADDSSAKVFKIGGSGPLTGGAAAYGDAVNKGAQIAVDEINAAGGINGVKIEWKMEDDEHDAEKGVNAYNSFRSIGYQNHYNITLSHTHFIIGMRNIFNFIHKIFVG